MGKSTIAPNDANTDLHANDVKNREYPLHSNSSQWYRAQNAWRQRIPSPFIKGFLRILYAENLGFDCLPSARLALRLT